MPAPIPALFPVNPTRRCWIYYAAAMGFLCLVYFGELREYPFDGDDDTYLRDSEEISKDFANLLFPSRYPGRPLVNLVLWAGYRLWGESPGAFHLLVVGVHLLVSLLLARLVVRLGASLETGLLSGLLFLVNVAHFRAVQWISAIAYPLMFAAGLIAILFCLRYLASRQPRFLVATYAAMLLAILAHPAAIALWGFSVYLCWSKERRLQGTALHLLPLGALLLLLIATTTYLYPMAPPVAAAARFPQPAELGQNLLWFLSRLVTTAYWIVWPIYEFSLWELWVGLAFLAGLAALIWRAQPWVAAWALWTLIALLPFITPAPALLRDIPQGGPSRFLYLASAGTAVLAAWGLLRMAQGVHQKAGPLYARALLVTAVLTLMTTSFFALKNAQAFTLYTAGRNSIAAGSALGITQLKQAITSPSAVIPKEDAYVRLCIHLLGTDEFATYLSAALQQFPTNTNLNIFKQVAASMSPDPVSGQQAASRLEKVLALTDGSQHEYLAALIAQSYGNLGLNRYRYGDLGTAVSAYRQALAIQPHSRAQFNLGLAYLRLGQLEPARQTYAEGVEKYGAAEGRQVGAVDDLRQLIAQGVQVAEAQRLLATYWQ